MTIPATDMLDVFFLQNKDLQNKIIKATMLFLKFFYDVYCYYVAERQTCVHADLQQTVTNLKNTSLILAKAMHALQVNLLFLFTLLATYWLSVEIGTQQIVWHTFVAFSLLYYVGDIALQATCFEKHDAVNIVHHVVMLVMAVLWFLIISDSYTTQHCAVMTYGIIEANSLLALPLRLRLMEKNNPDQCTLNKQYLPACCTKTVAGILFATTFFVTRFVAWPYYWWHYASHTLPPSVNRFGLAPIFLLSSFWLYKLAQGIAKELSSRGQEKIKMD